MISAPALHASPHKGSRNGCPVKLVVIHADAGKSDLGTVSWLQNPESKVSYHYLIGRDGKVYQFVDESERAWHAGISSWPDCAVQKSVNAYSVGVSFANDGKEAYRDVQYVVGAELVADICKRHGIALANVVGHCDVSPGRKLDPYAHFDWTSFENLLTSEGVR